MTLLHIENQAPVAFSNYIADRHAPCAPSLKLDEFDVPDRFAAQCRLVADRPALPDIDTKVYRHTS